MSRAYLDASFTPSAIDEQFRELTEERDWRTEARDLRDMDADLGPCPGGEVRVTEHPEGFEWRCRDCGEREIHATEATAIEQGELHGYVMTRDWRYGPSGIVWAEA